MTGLHIVSTTPQAGKNLIAFSLGHLLQKSGYAVGYMKPMGKLAQIEEGFIGDADALVVQEVLGQNVKPNILSPVMLPDSLHALALFSRDKHGDFFELIAQAYSSISKNKDVTLVGGIDSFPGTGRFCGMDGLTVTRMLNLRVLVILSYPDQIYYDNLLFLKDILGGMLLGVIINNVPETALRDARGLLAPYLQKNGLDVFAVIPQCASLASMRVADLANDLAGYIIAGNQGAANRVDGFIIGAMQVSNFVSYAQQHAKKAVVVSGDKIDLQLAALLNKNPCIILTENITPCEIVRQRAEQIHVPLITVKDDTYSVAKNMAQLFKGKKLRDLSQIRLGIQHVEKYLSFDKLINALGFFQEH